MTELTSVLTLKTDWHSSNHPEVLWKIRRTCEYIFNGPQIVKDEAEKVQYIMLLGQQRWS